jgi:two-component system invasion response regulator UvrY
MKNILLADDHAIIRGGLRVLINSYLSHSTVDEASDGDSAFEKVKENDYHLIVLDVNMPGTDTFGLVHNIISIRPHSNILMFSMNAEKIYARKFLQLGAKGYLSKGSSEDEIRTAIDQVLEGKRYLSPSLITLLTEEALGNSDGNPFNNLSSREIEIVSHLIKGESSTEICRILNLQPSTVGTFKSRIFEKLKCKNLIEVMDLAKVHTLAAKI